jgi:serine/threonine protein kinase/glutamine cyclotransferase
VDTDSRIGTEFAGYRIESVLGRGGMGVVYLATDTRLGRQVALKLLSPDLSSDQRFRDRFIQESRMAAGLEHHGIVPVHEAGEHEGQLYIAMRHISGDDLASLIERDGPLSLDRTASIIEQVADALDTAHERGLIHRDVKPANILVEAGRRDRAYLTDFGVTKRTASKSGLTQTGQFMGTVDYVAPEQIEGKEVDGRADQYSLGCVAYECLAGEAPFAKDSEVATIYAHLQEERPHPSTRRDGIPGTVDGVLAKAMAKRPEDRYDTCSAMAEALRQAATAPAVVPARTGPSRRALAIALAAALVVAAVAVLAVLATRDSGRSSPSTSPSTTGPVGTVPALARIDPRTNRVVRTFDFQAGALAVDAGAVWALGSAEVVKINAATNTIVAHVPIRQVGGFAFSPGSYSVAVGEGGVWVTAPPSLVKIDPSRNEVTESRPAKSVGCPSCPAGPLDPNGVRAAFGSVWVLNPTAGVLAKVDPDTLKTTSTVRIPIPTGVAVGEGAVWMTNAIDDVLYRIDPATGKIAKKIALAGSASGVTVGDGAVWVASSSNGTVIRVDPAENRAVETIPVGRGVKALAVGAGALWAMNGVSGEVVRIDPATDTVVVSIPLGTCRAGGEASIAASDDAVWVGAKCV